MDQLSLEEKLNNEQPLVYCERKSCSYCCDGRCSHICITIGKNGICTSGDEEIKEKDLL